MNDELAIIIQVRQMVEEIKKDFKDIKSKMSLMNDRLGSIEGSVDNIRTYTSSTEEAIKGVESELETVEDMLKES